MQEQIISSGLLYLLLVVYGTHCLIIFLHSSSLSLLKLKLQNHFNDIISIILLLIIKKSSCGGNPLILSSFHSFW